MNPLHAMLNLAHRALNHAHTQAVRGSFAAWGKDSRLGRGSRLIEPHLIHVGDSVSVAEHAWLNAKDDRGDAMPTLFIGDGTCIGRFVQINAWRSVRIGRNVLVADRVFISDADHNYADRAVPVLQQGDRFVGAVVLEDGCWLGIGAVILPGVTVAQNAVVAANAVVTRDVPAHCVVAGAPARIIRQL